MKSGESVSVVRRGENQKGNSTDGESDVTSLPYLLPQYRRVPEKKNRNMGRVRRKGGENEKKECFLFLYLPPIQFTPKRKKES